MADQKGENQHFVVDGWNEGDVAIESMVRAEVEAEYAEQLKAASSWRRFWLRRKIEREIRRRMGELLYSACTHAPPHDASHHT